MAYDTIKPYKHAVLSSIERTWKTPYVEVKNGLYPIVTKRFTDQEIQHTDGIGTKGIHHWAARTFTHAVIDALAMNLNDLLMAGATPYALQNHITLPEDDHEAILEIIAALVAECKMRNIAITGGETSIHENTDALDLSITLLGFLKQERTNCCEVGDVLIGLRSSGLHSNGITTARKILDSEGKWSKEFTFPTTIYSDIVLPLLHDHVIHGMMHITGGAFAKLKDILRSDTDVHIADHLQPQNIFFELSKELSDIEMYSTFNCGTGFILSVPESGSAALVSKLSAFEAKIIGSVVPGNGFMRIHSAFSGKDFTL